MNHEQAVYIAKQLERFLEGTTANIGVGGIITELRKAGGEPLDIITAAWATVRKIKSGKYKTFQMIHNEIAEMLISDYAPATTTPSPVPQASYRPYQQSTAHQPVNPRLEPECPTHPGQRAANCGGCRADRLAGTPAEYPALRALPDIA